MDKEYSFGETSRRAFYQKIAGLGVGFLALIFGRGKPQTAYAQTPDNSIFIESGHSADWKNGLIVQETSGKHIRFLTNGANRLFIQNDGLVGVGTTNPTEKLEVSGAVLAGSLKIPTAQMMSEAGHSADWKNGLIVQETSGKHIRFLTNGANRLFIQNDGLVGIGTINPQTELSVNGTITSREIITTASGWPDDVFAEYYKLMPLDELEQHIEAHKHLPGIPTAAEVSQEGVKVGEMQATLLQKVEELYLHTIAQQKEIEALKKEVRELRNNS